MGPKIKAFCPRIDMLKGDHCILMIREAPLHQSAKMVLSKSIFYVKNQFSKIMPNFWRTGAPHILKIQPFPLSMSILGQKACIWWVLDPPSLKFHNRTDISVDFQTATTNTWELFDHKSFLQNIFWYLPN